MRNLDESSEATVHKASVVIVGAGPVGLLTALRLGQAGIDTLVIENHHEVLPATRAMVYMPVVIPILTKLGIIDDVLKEAFLNKEGVYWRDVDGKELANLPLSSSTPGEFGGVLLLGQYRMTVLILEELKKYPCVEVHFGLRCVGIEDDQKAEVVKIMASPRKNLASSIFIEAKYVLGTDGANSSVRNMLCIPFEGFTYPGWKMIGADLEYDFIKDEGYTPLNFIVHPKDWAVIAYTGQDVGGLPAGSGRPQWRLAYVEEPDLPDSAEDYRQRAQERVKTWIKSGKEYKILRAEPYINHQRCAATFRKGRVMLAGDASHSNNPIGGLGMTSGILDAFAYGNAFTRVLGHGEPDTLLTECANSRREAWIQATNMLSQANLNRLRGDDEETVKSREGFFHALKTNKDFPKMVRAGFDKMIPDTFEASKAQPVS